MNDLDIKKVAIYTGLALLAYKLFNTKISVSTGLAEKKGIELNVTGGGIGNLTADGKPKPDPVIDIPGAVSTAPISPYMGIAPGSVPYYDQVINVAW